MLHRLLAFHELEHRREPLLGLLVSEKEAPAALEKEGDVVEVRTREVIQADFEDVKDEMRGNNFELGEVGEEGNVLLTDEERWSISGRRG